MSNITTKAKSFWDTKEGTTGMVVGLGIFGAIGYGAYKIMPYLANLMENTFYTILFGALSVGLFYALVIDNTLRSRLWLAYKLLMRAVTYSIIAYDPVGVLRELQKKAKERIEDIAGNRNAVNGQVKQVEATVNSLLKDEKDLINKLEIQRKNGGDELEIRSNLSKLGKVRAAIERMKKALDQVKGFYDQLNRAYKALVIIDGDLDFEIGINEREYKAVTAAHTAWKAVRAAFKGTDEIDSLRADTLAWMAEDYGNKLGAIESFMEDSKSFIDGVDLQQMMYAEDGLKVLEGLNAYDLNVVQSKPALTQAVPNVLTPNLVGGRAKTVDYVVKK
jgi:hypothetical protein